MKIQRLFLAFITITAIGFLYEKYKKKYEPDEETQNLSLVKNKHLDLIDAISKITYNPAKILGLNVGSIQPKSEADLITLFLV